MTENNNQRNVTYDSLKEGMQEQFAYMLANDQYNGRYSERFACLEELVCDVVEECTEQERSEQERSNHVLKDFSRTLSDTESGAPGGGSRPVVGAVPMIPLNPTSEVADKLPILTTGLAPIAPDLVTRGYLCNDGTLPPDSTIIPVTPKLQHGGFDGGAKNCFFGTWNPPAFVTLMGQLESGKTSAALPLQCNPDAELEPGIITLAGRNVAVYPKGVQMPPYYAYHICFDGFDVFIHKDITPKNDNPQIWVDYRAESVLKYGGLYQAQQVLLDFLQELGFTKKQERLSRADIHIMIDVAVSAFTKLYLADHDVTKSRGFVINGKKRRWGKDIETFTTGSLERIQLIIYNKRREMEKKKNKDTAAKYAMTRANIGEEWYESDRPITRIEYRMGRDVLRELGINSLEDLRKSERAIVQYLTHDWFRLLKDEKVRGTENDAPIHPLWERVQSLFFQHFSCADVERVEWKEKIISVDCEALDKQGAGCFDSSSIPRFGEQKSVADLRQRLHWQVDRVVDEEFLEKHNRKARLLQTEKGVTYGVEPSKETPEGSCGNDLEYHRSWDNFMTPTYHLRR